MFHRITEIMRRLVPNAFVNPEKILGACLYCGETVHYKDGSNHFYEATPAHFACRRLVREAEKTPLLLQRSYLRVAETMHRYSPELFLEIEDDLVPFIKQERPSVEDLYRLIAFVLKAAEQSESVTEFGRRALNKHLAEIRQPFLASAN